MHMLYLPQTPSARTASERGGPGGPAPLLPSSWSHLALLLPLALCSRKDLLGHQGGSTGSREIKRKPGKMANPYVSASVMPVLGALWCGPADRCTEGATRHHARLYCPALLAWLVVFLPTESSLFKFASFVACVIAP